MLSAAAIPRASDDSPGRVPSGLSPSAAAPLERDGDAVFARDTLFVLFDPTLADAAIDARVTQLNVEWEWCSLTCGTLGGPEYWAVPIQIPLTLLSEAYVALMKI